jgi:hypothetical protein
VKKLIVLTSHDQLGDTGAVTCVWRDEWADPFFTFKDAGAQIILASPNCGLAPLDPQRMTADNQTNGTSRIQQGVDAPDAWRTSLAFRNHCRSMHGLLRHCYDSLERNLVMYPTQ